MRRAMAVGILAVGALIGIRAVAVLGERARVALVAFGFELHRVSLTLIATALLFFAIFIVATPILNRIVLHPPARARAIVRWFGNLTFPIYLFHFPMFVFLGALQLYDRNSVLRRVAAFLLVLAIIAAIAPATDYFKIRLRTTLSWTFTKSRAYCAAVALAVLE